MYPILYEQITAGTVPQHNGLGVLSDCLSCKVEQERNGIYELTLEYPITGLHAEELAVRRILKVKPNFTDDAQLFRIDRIGKVMNGKFTVYAKHNSYDLSGNDIVSGEATSAAAACSLLQSAAQGYSITTDKTVSGNFKIDAPSSVRSWFGGKKGSILDVFGTAEIKYDNFRIQFLLHAGQDRGVTIRYGKNLLELSQEIGDSLYTHVRAFYKGSDDVVVSGNKVATGLTLDVPKTLLLDLSTEYQSAPTVAQLTTRTEEYISSHNLTTPTNNIKLDFVQSSELANRVDLCDTVNVYYEALGITRTQVKCIRTVYDCLKERYTETEFGDAKTNITDTIVQTNQALSERPTSSTMANAVERATKLITGNLGGYIILHDSDNDGEPDEILIMDSDDIETAQKLWRWNKNGLGYSKTGYRGSYGLAMTAAGEIVADYITTGTLDADLIKTGVLQDRNGNSEIDMTSGQAIMNNFKAKNSLLLIDNNSVERGRLSYQIEDSQWTSMFQLKNPNNIVGIYAYSDPTGNGVQVKTESGYRAALISGSDTRSGHRGGGHIFLYDGTSSQNRPIWLTGDTGNITCVSLTQTSSRKVKENIRDIEDAEAVLLLQAVAFDFKDKTKGMDKRGFIAEDVAEVLPNLVTPETEDAPASIDYIGMIPYLQDIIKKQEKRITALENKLNAIIEKNGEVK